MSQNVNKVDVITPSAASIGFSVFGIFVGIFFIILPRLGGDAFLSLMFGSDASQSLIDSSKDSYGPLIKQLLSSDLLGRAVVFGLWAFVGLCTFVLITSVMGIITTVEEQTKEMGYIHQRKDTLIRDDLVSVAYRMLIAAFWATFITISIRYVLSYFTVTGFVALGGNGHVSDWLIFGLASIIFGVSLHIQIVFARLLLGRTRIWTD